MRIECVVDSASLVSLAKSGLENYLGRLDWALLTVEEVFEEVVELGLQKGFLDALKAKRLFDDETIRIARESPIKHRQGGSTDDRVVRLAMEKRAVMLTNDVKLARKALAAGVEVLGSADICLLLKEKKRISREEFETAIARLVENQRLSDKNAEKYLEGV